MRQPEEILARLAAALEGTDGHCCIDHEQHGSWCFACERESHAEDCPVAEALAWWTRRESAAHLEVAARALVEGLESDEVSHREVCARLEAVKFALARARAADTATASVSEDSER